MFRVIDGTAIRNIGLTDLFVASKAATTGYYVGGLVGEAALNPNTIISNSYVDGSISGTRDVGGLAGLNRGAITNSYASGSVTASSNDAAGGLVGINIGGSITNCYATASVSGTNAVGGLVGNNSAGGAGTITTSYSTGEVTGTGTAVGGLLGADNSTGTITSSFWDKDTSGQDTSAGGTGLTTADMQATSGAIRDGLGIDNWLFEADSYPRLCYDDDGDVVYGK